MTTAMLLPLSLAARGGQLLPMLSGALALGGVFVAALGLRRRPPALAAVLGAAVTQVAWRDALEPTGTGRLDRVGLWMAQRFPLPRATVRALATAGQSPVDLMVQKLVFASLGLLVPGMALAAAVVTGQPGAPMPLWTSLLLALIGWFVPDVLLWGSRNSRVENATEALFTYVDLVVLERMANQSATQALTRAASMADTVLFRELRAALDRARFEQRPAWQALHAVAQRLDLPQLSDIADVVRMDEQGAAVGETLRARALELRDAHLMTRKIEAQRVSESLTIWMVVPAMVFGLILLAPPLLRMTS